ncbi:GNAT family N-acetyltransferase [Halorarius halobius]|uniref:GNAT family N-acetyltransferase n=1 Tax=Halorarius halobius TaxID=2962671 RepID=UPI0020CC8A66|nr:GNAT family protein [Halorarius halobius]
MPGPAFTTGEKVSLHPIEDEDHAFLQRGRNDRSTRVPLTDTTIRSREDVSELADDDYRFLVCTREDGELLRVGVVAFAYTRGDDWGSLMYWTAPDHRREGYVSEALDLFLEYAFRECGFHKVVGRVLVTNEASVGTLESLGFEREGQFREERFADGEWTDAYQYALLAREWLDT